ncbi:flagellar biosynthesis anti-sigma factor FlgM [Oligoflexia bacterium]|nr:flagellar biosynthesis anti-sigma factor FlgM [Oligoflexia bacterium]
MNDLPGDNRPKQTRKRSMTSITLGWLAERLKRCEAIKEQLESGVYKVDNEKVANALLDDDS